tara:strand:+ start:88 stop:642 length:555 start_codon:yes stop_codon:yes gene_type:complete
MVSTWLNGLVSGTVIPPGWTALQSSTLGSDTATVTFTSAGSAQPWSLFQDLVVIQYCQSDTEAHSRIQFNNDTASNYELQEFYSDGSNDYAYAYATAYIFCGYIPRVADGANVFGGNITHIFDINSGKYTSTLSQFAADFDGSGYVGLTACTWEAVAAVTELDIYPHTGDFKTGSMFSLFGVAA